MPKIYRIEVLGWDSPQQPKLKAVREQVFIIEQHVPLSIEWDEHDAEAIHLLAVDEDNHAIGCARILKKGRIGRMAVLAEWRGKGVGRALLSEALMVCKQLGMERVALSSQTHAIKFYQQAGFKVTTDVYTDANIWHVDMERQI